MTDEQVEAFVARYVHSYLSVDLIADPCIIAICLHTSSSQMAFRKAAL